MNEINESQVRKYEEQLRLAMIASDASELNDLLSDELLFTNHLGQLVSKVEDLRGHESGMMKIYELAPKEQFIQIHGEVAIVSVLVHLAGSYNGIPGEGNFRFTRAWAMSSNGRLQVVAGHASIVA